MKKLLLAVPLVAGASWAGASYYTGAQTQDAYEQLLAQLNEMKPFTLVNESYTSGFVRSQAVTQVMDSASADARVLFRLQHDIDHTPLGVDEGLVRVGAAAIRTTLVRDDSLPESLVDFLTGFVEAEPFIIDTQVRFNGDTDTRLQLSPYQYQHEGVDVDFDGIDYSMVVAGDSVLGSGTLGAIEFSREGGVLHLSPGKITTDLARIDQSVYSGSNGIEFDRFTISSDNQSGPQATLESIGLKSNTQVEDDQLSSQTRLSIASIDSPLPLHAASLETSVSKLSIEGIQSYVDTISQLSIADAMLSDDPDIARRVLEAYLPMIGPGTGLDVGVAFSNEGGDASLSYGIGVIDDSVPGFPVNGLTSIVTLRDLLNVLTLEAHLAADAAAIDQTPLAMFMMSPQAQQVVVADGISYTSDMTLKELIVDINGNPLALEMLLGDKLDIPLTDIMTL